MSDSDADVIVVGAGIVGAACADACARAGLRVIVCEAAVIGGGATAAGMGHLTVMDDSEAQFALTHRSLGLWHALAPALPAAAEYTRCGTIWVAADGEEMEAAEAKHRYCADRGVVTEMLDGPALARHEPHLRPGLAGGVRVPGDAICYSPVAAAWLLERSGARVRHAAVRAIGGGRVECADGAVLRAPAIINACGADAARLTPGLPIRPRKGHLVITDRYPGLVRHELVELGYIKSAHSQDGGDSVAFNVQPRATGQLLFGSSRQFDARDAAVDHAILARMLRRCAAFMPALDDLLAIRTWTGFRAATPDSLPLIGPWPGDASVWLATGHEGLGITTALGTAELIAHHLAGAPTGLPVAPYLPARFEGVAGHAHHH
ncbi:MAG TPA: FAD-dependent oxidoreductase [Terriglobales bacterium]|jgi:glycine/D-amino acid oxidase-like deaminating enzyme